MDLIITIQSIADLDTVASWAAGILPGATVKAADLPGFYHASITLPAADAKKLFGATLGRKFKGELMGAPVTMRMFARSGDCE